MGGFTWPTELPTSDDAVHGWPAAWWIPAIVIALLVVRLVAIRRAGSVGVVTGARSHRVTHIVLALAALVSVVNYFDYGLFRYDTYLNEWDVFHYYLGTRYTEEIGYTSLYVATLMADRELGATIPDGNRGRDLRNNTPMAAGEINSRGSEVAQRFSPDRWREFVADVRWLRDSLPPDKWPTLIEDHGYNGTPIWTTVVGTLLTQPLRLQNTWQRALLLAIDPALLAVMFIAIAWAFGTRAALLTVVLVGTHYFLSWGHLKGSILRTDFAVCTVLSACLLRRGQPALAGACLGWATASRVFPILFALGPLAGWAFVSIQQRRVARDAVNFVGAFATVILIGGAWSLQMIGLAHWAEWVDKITTHADAPTIWGVGFTTLVRTHSVNGVPEALFADAIADEPYLAQLTAVGIWLPRLTIGAATLYFATRLAPHRALLLGFVFVFFLVAPTYYYYLIVVLPLLFFSERIDEPTGVLGTALLLLGGMAGYLYFAGWPTLAPHITSLRGWHQDYPTTYYMTWWLCISALHMCWLAMREAGTNIARG